ncbi:MAG: peptidoglycan-binding protein [Clostridia bacterium]|nr:peptidoglycan-binding protein [Clostridia bacterium]
MSDQNNFWNSANNDDDNLDNSFSSPDFTSDLLDRSNIFDDLSLDPSLDSSMEIDLDENLNRDDGIGYDASLGDNEQPDFDMSKFEDYGNFDPNKEYSNLIGDPAADMEHWHLQSYDDTCAIVSQEFILEEFLQKDFSEDELRSEALENGWYNNGTPLEYIHKLLELHGLNTEQKQDASFDDLENSLREGDRIIVGVHSLELYFDNAYADSMVEPGSSFMPGYDMDHAIEVIGVDYSDPENPMVIVNDPGIHKGQGMLIPKEKFEDAWKDSFNYMVSVDRPGTESSPSQNNVAPQQETDYTYSYDTSNEDADYEVNYTDYAPTEQTEYNHEYYSGMDEAAATDEQNTFNQTNPTEEEQIAMQDGGADDYNRPNDYAYNESVTDDVYSEPLVNSEVTEEQIANQDKEEELQKIEDPKNTGQNEPKTDHSDYTQPIDPHQESAVFHHNLSYNPNVVDKDVMELQKQLNEMGYTGADGKPLAVDGRFGSNTLFAINIFKQAEGLDNSHGNHGVVNHQTWDQLFNNSDHELHTKDTAGNISYNPGKFNSDVVEIQQRLNELGYKGANGQPLKVDGLYGPETLHAINDYKHYMHIDYNGAEPQGAVGPETWNHLFGNDQTPEEPGFHKNLSYSPSKYDGDVEEVQRRLNDLGYTGKDGKPLAEDGHFGENTQYAINVFKHAEGLERNGVVDHNTWDHLFDHSESNEVHTKDISGLISYNPGKFSEDVVEIQQQLNDMGYKGANGSPLKVDGVFGPETLHAIKDFKSAMHIDNNPNEPGGSVGNDTWKVLFGQSAGNK